MKQQTRGSLFLFTITLALGGELMAGSPWTRAQGEGFFQLSTYDVGPYDSLFLDGDDRFRTSREIEDRTIEGYFEYGVNDRWTLLASVPYKMVEAGSLEANPTLPPTIGSGSLDELGNIVVGARRKIREARVVLSTQLDLELPTGDFDMSTGLSTGYDATTVTPTLHAGTSWDRTYLSAYAGFGLRSDDFSNDWRLGVEGGYRFFGRLWVVGVADVVQSFEDGDVTLPTSNLETGLFVNDQEYVAYGMKFLLDITDRIGLQFTSHSAASGNGVARSSLTGGGVYFKW